MLGSLAIVLSLGALGLYLLFPALLRARNAQEVAGTVNRMRMILAACQQYAADNNDFLPPSITPLVTFYGLPAKALRDVRSPEPPMTQPTTPDLEWEKYDANVQAHCDFAYTGAGLRLTLSGPDQVMVLYAKRPTGKARLIGFADGHVDRVPASEYPRVLDPTNEALAGRHRPTLPLDLLNSPAP